MERYLTKSKFKLALECPAKLFYTGKKEYIDSKLDDAFLKALAEGGFQVGELAKLYYPGGYNIDMLDHQQALDKTEELLKQENTIIFEAAFHYRDLFIRADIVVKKGNSLKVIEVKSKSYDSSADQFVGVKGGISAKWKPYIYDIAFQKYVLCKACPDLTVSAYLCLADKTKRTTIEGLNQRFLLYQENGRTKVKVREQGDLGNKILIEVNVDDICDRIVNGGILHDERYKTLDELVNNYLDYYLRDERLLEKVHGKCGACEFRATNDQLIDGKKSGFQECWTDAAKFLASDFDRGLILDIWDLRKKDEFIDSGKYFIDQIDRTDLEGKSTKKTIEPVGLSRVDRQYLQVQKIKEKDLSHYIDISGLRNEMEHWSYPLHFIDFETTSVAIPFNSGRRPYEQVAFQFSHHVVQSDGRIAHQDEWINLERGVFPNYLFVRALKKALDKDNGTIFRYSNHENTILNTIYNQLLESSEPDKALLCNWIKMITKSKQDSVDKWLGERNMVDLLEVCKNFYYNPLMGGSNSLKYLLPAILNTSEFLKEKYSHPIYGSQIQSLNYTNQIWIVPANNGSIKNPYKLLPPVNEGYDNELLDALVIDEETGIADGGAAMIAYARMQFQEMGTEERQRIATALLRYCELDTFAMVMLWEAWHSWCLT